MRIVIDTGIFYRPRAVEALAQSQRDVVVPTIVLAERIRQVVRDGFDANAFRRVVDRCQFLVEALDEEAALRRTANIHDDDLWQRVARDALIAGHVRPGDVLWTTDREDFLAVGLREEQVVAVQ